MKSRSLLLALSAVAFSSFTFAQEGSVAIPAKIAATEAKIKEVEAAIKEAGDAQDDLVKKMLEELAKMKDRLESMGKELVEVKKQLDAQKKASNDAGRNSWRTFIQVQYRDTNQRGGEADAFQVKRARMGIQQTIDPSTWFRISFDVATGTTQNTAQLRDALISYTPNQDDKDHTSEIKMGQFSLPLGYEIERSDTDREMPERSTYNLIMFNGDRGRGVQWIQRIDENTQVSLGGWNSLTQGDPEQRNFGPAPQSRHAMTGGIRYKKGDLELGLTGLSGKRASVTTTRTVNNATVTTISPEVRREFIFLDGALRNFLTPHLTLRAEAMFGKDRVPITPGSNSNVTAPVGRNSMRGGHFLLNYDFDPKNALSMRAESFDPNTGVSGNTIEGLGMAWQHFLNPKARVTLAQEYIRDNGSTNGQKRYHVTTLRVTFKF